MPTKLNRRRIETTIAALVAIGAAIVGLAVSEHRTLGPKFVGLDRIARLKNPVFLAQPPGPGSDLYVVQKGGAVRIIAEDRLLRRPFLDIRALVEAHGVRSEPGMASIAFPANYVRSGRFYLSYTDHRGALVVAEFQRSATDPRLAEPGSMRALLRIPESSPAHHGGLMAFGPDGFLYVGTGDGGTPSAAQNMTDLRGKLLRIDPTRPGSHQLWAYGLRNPRGISFDAARRHDRDRRCRRGPLRGDQLPAARRVARGELRLAGLRGVRTAGGRHPAKGHGGAHDRLPARPGMRGGGGLRGT